MDAPRKFGLIEIRPEDVPAWKEWGAVLMGEKHTEALETLKEEGLTQEHVFLLEIDGTFFLGFFTEGDSLPANMERELNRQHKDLLMRSSKRKIKGSVLYSLKRNA